MSKTQDTSATTSSDETVFDGSRWLGRVKWFNNRAGFGFITVLEGEKKGEDVFTHHSGISVDTEQYKYLVQGEYVTFELRSSDNTEHPYQAGNVKGVLEGMLMCETRNEIRQSTAVYNEQKGKTTSNRRGKKQTRDSQSANDKWVVDNAKRSVEQA